MTSTMGLVVLSKLILLHLTPVSTPDWHGLGRYLLDIVELGTFSTTYS